MPFLITIVTNDRIKKVCITKQICIISHVVHVFNCSVIHTLLFLQQSTLHKFKRKITITNRSVNGNNQELLSFWKFTMTGNWDAFFLDNYIHTFWVGSQMRHTTNHLYHFFILTHLDSIKQLSTVDPVEQLFSSEHITDSIPHISILISVLNMVQMFITKRQIYVRFGFPVLFSPADKGSIIIRCRCRKLIIKILEQKQLLSFLLP